MAINFGYTTIIFIIPLFLACQNENENCRIAKTGTFYYYPRKTNRQFQIIRTNNLQTEINLATGDSSFWTIKWQDECTFSLLYVRNTRIMSDKEKEFTNSHVVNCKILTVGLSVSILRQTCPGTLG